MPDALTVLDAIPAEQVGAAIARLAGRLLVPRPEGAADDTLLTPDEAAALLKADRRWIYKHAAELGAVHLSRRKLRFSRRKVLRRVEARK
jgi:hypothetical protein